jgi:hypothetical protein
MDEDMLIWDVLCKVNLFALDHMCHALNKNVLFCLSSGVPDEIRKYNSLSSKRQCKDNIHPLSRLGRR